MSGNADPDHLFKYRSLIGAARERTRRIILNSAIWFSSPADFNDPFDCSPVFSMEATKPETDKFLRTLFREQSVGTPRHERRTMVKLAQRNPARSPDSPAFLAELQRRQTKTINSVGVLSLSALSDQVLMWSHYADAHAGICLRFTYTASSFPFWMAFKVTYAEHRPIVNAIKDDHDALLEKVIMTKADFWSYEEEWRAINHPNSEVAAKGGPGLVAFAPKALDGIILGARISDADAAEVISWVKGRQHPVEILQAKPDQDIFRLNIVKP